MKKVLLAGMLAAAFCDASAFAADLPPVPAPAGWTGCYIGANTGYAWAHKDSTRTAQGPTVAGLVPVNFYLGTTNVDGWSYGGQIGCDYQITGNLVAGIRGMWDGANMTGANVHPANINSNNSSHFKIDSFGTVVGKLGFLPIPTVEVYGLAGAAWVHDDLRYFDTVVGQFAAGNQTRSGYDLGAGVSWMFAPNWDLWAEYDHMDFGTKTLRISGAGVYDNRVKQNLDKVLVGVEYRFSFGNPPVVAKY